MAYQELLQFDENKKTFKAAPAKSDKKKTVQKKDLNRGCDFCPLNKMKGLKKVKNLDKLQGKSIMVWAQNPGAEENRQGKELVGPAGDFLWQHASAVGLKREDCDIQNVVRCWTVTENEFGQWVPRSPAKEEIRCCSIYTDEALEKVAGKTKVHLVFGEVAAKALLKGEYRKDQKTFFSDRLKSWVILTYHPSYFLRGAPRSKLKEFQEALATAVAKIKGGAERFSYILAQDYKSVPASRMKEELVDPIKEMAAKGIVTAIDIEDGTDEDGNNKIVYIGAAWKKGHSRGTFINHKNLKKDPDADQAKYHWWKELLEDPTILKAFHNGVYDIWKLWKLMRIKVRGFVHDTYISEYLRFSGRRVWGLESISDIRFREFAGYKRIIDEHRDKQTKLANFYTLPMKTIAIYNGADCDLTKRIQRSNDGKISEALLRMMMKVSPVLARMEKRGPWLDFQHADLLDTYLPIKIAKLLKSLRDLAGDEKYNPNSSIQNSAVVYDKLKLGKYLDDEWKHDHKRSCGKETMQLLSDFHQLPKLLLEFRKISKKKSTYVDAYRKSALRHEGRVRTKWWLTGTITCRLRSGGEKIKKEGEESDKQKGIVNLQNIHGDPAIECLLVSDLRWRDLYKEWRSRQ